MKLSHIVLIIYLGLIIGSLLIFFLGDEGWYQYKVLLNHEEKLKKNLEHLKQTHSDLSRQLEALRTSPEVIRLLARELGYYRPDETVININGSRPTHNFYEVGKLLKRIPSSKNRNLILRIIGIALSTLCVLLFVLLKKRKRHDYKRG
ncbi:MAG: septum formation initiator family protein [Spirochaetales bacterium]|nr:septum formation initiator family protein [Spirochaetales bacterium]